MIFVGTWVVAAQWIRAELWAGLLAVAYLPVITAAADADARGRRTPWRSRPMVWLGEVSFAFYLVHVSLMQTVLRLAGQDGVGLRGGWGPLVVLGFLAVNLLLAAALHRWVETPMMRRLGPPRRARARTTPAVAPPAPSGPADAARETRPIEYAGRRGPG